jgi:hypothetical protein
MKYLMLIYYQESAWDALSPEEHDRRRGEFDAYSRKLAQAGKIIDGRPLHPTRTATTIRSRQGRLEMVDGPFAETKEQLGGFYLMETKDLDEMLALAAECPGAKYGALEIRPVAPRGDGG